MKITSEIFSNTWVNFAKLVKKNITENRNLLEKVSSMDTCVYGASARSSTLLNALNLGKEKFSGIADKNNLKWGKLSPVLGLKIDKPSIVISNKIKNIFIAAFNFESEIKQNLISELNWSGKVIVPLPNLPRTYTI